jgi:dTDP-glucose 4,6-dehydratase
MKYLVTGGAGFIGSEAVRQLVKSGHEVCVIDSLTYAGNLFSLESVIDKIKFYEISINNSELLFEKIGNEKFDGILNFAAETHVDNSIISPTEFIQTNILGTFHLLNLARKMKCLMLQISTDEIYGSTTTGSFKEQDSQNPSSPYSGSKAAAEMLVMSYFKTYSVKTLIVRCSNNYGPFQHPEKLIPSFISKAQRNEKLPVYGTGLNIREWIHVTDCVRAILMVLEHGQFGEIYNISSGEFKTNLEITLSLLKLLNKSESLIEYVEDRVGHDYRYAVDSSKIRTELKWLPEIQFSQGLESTVDWYIKNTHHSNKKKRFHVV